MQASDKKVPSKGKKSSQERQNSGEQQSNLRLVQDKLGQYQKIIKDQRMELDEQRRMNEKLKKTL